MREKTTKKGFLIDHKADKEMILSTEQAIDNNENFSKS